MKDLLDRSFWRFLSGFALILLVSVSLLTLLGNYRAIKKQVAALLTAYHQNH